jgi:hypothetical protein
MRWNAQSGHARLGPGTSFLVFQTPYIVGYEPDPIRAGDELWIEYGTNGRDAAHVLEATDAWMKIQLKSTGTLLQLTPRQPDEQPISISWSGPSQEWVVRA